MTTPIQLILLRHGQSEWNLENRFTGWIDVDLSAEGVAEAKAAGELLKREGLPFARVYTSYLLRAVKTMWLALEAAGQFHLPVVPAWQLNERHYGALAGLNKADTAAKYGEEQVKIWRRSYGIRPPLLDALDVNNPAADARYAALSTAQKPCGESLADTVSRVGGYFAAEIAPALRAGQPTLVVAHGNSIRALIQYIKRMSEADILELNIPTGQPLVYTLAVDDRAPAGFRVLSHRYLGDAAAVAERAKAVAMQGKA